MSDAAASVQRRLVGQFVFYTVGSFNSFTFPVPIATGN